MSLDEIRREESKKAYEDGSAAPTLKEGASNPEAAPHLAKAMSESLKDKESSEYLERAVQAMSSQDKQKLLSILDKIESDFANSGSRPWDFWDKVQMTFAGVSGIAGILFWALLGAEAGAPFMGFSGTAAAVPTINDVAYESRFRKRLDSLRSLIES